MLKATLYYGYVKDRLGADILENECGFLVYKISDGECFIVDMYMLDKGQGHGRSLIDDLKQIASKESCKYISGNIHLADKNQSNTLAAALAVGFKVVLANSTTLTIAMEV